MTDFFISYNKDDRSWAEWLAWQLEEAGYTTTLQAWDFRPGANFVQDMDRATREAERTIAVLSPSYIRAVFPHPEWGAAFAVDPTGVRRKLVTVRVRQVELQGLLAQIVYIDLVGLDGDAARQRLLEGVREGRGKPARAPAFPGTVQHTVSPPTRFPGGDQRSAIAGAPPSPADLTRLEHLKDLLRQNEELLNAYQEELLYASDPKQKLKYRREIEGLQTLLDQYTEEYNALRSHLDASREPEVEVVGQQIRQMDAKLDQVLAGQATIRTDIATLRVTILERFDESEQRLLEGVVQMLNADQVEIVGAVITAIQADAISQEEMQSALDSMRDTLAAVGRQQGALSDATLSGPVVDVAAIVEDPTLSISHRLAVSIPIVPLILSYDASIDLGSGVNLTAVWERLIGWVRGGR